MQWGLCMWMAALELLEREDLERVAILFQEREHVGRAGRERHGSQSRVQRRRRRHDTAR